MRIAAVSPFVDKRHGTERAFAELLGGLAGSYGCEIHLYSQRVRDLPLARMRDPHEPRRGAIFWHRVPAAPGPHFFQFICWFFVNWIWRKSHELFRGLTFDLVLSPGINCLDADFVIVHALFSRLREVAMRDFAEARPHAGFLRRLHRRSYYALLAALERRMYSKPEVTLAAVSALTADRLAHYFHRREVSVIPNGIDPAEFNVEARMSLRTGARVSRKFSGTDFVLLLIGNDWHTKGLATILAAMASCTDIPLLLLLAGDDSASAARETVSRFDLLARCRFEPSRQDVVDFYAAADIYVSPSHEDSFGMPVAEAMACGLPVVTSASAGISAGIADGVDGFVLRDPHDAASLASILRMLYEQKELAARVGQAAASTAARWTWDRNAASFWPLMQRAAARRRKAP